MIFDKRTNFKAKYNPRKQLALLWIFNFIKKIKKNEVKTQTDDHRCDTKRSEVFQIISHFVGKSKYQKPWTIFEA